MKRVQRKIHFVIWLVLAPLIAVVLWLALSHRPEAPVNPELPEALVEEAS